MLSGEAGARCAGGGVLALAPLYPPPRTEFLPPAPPPRPLARYPPRPPGLPAAPGYPRPPPHVSAPPYRSPAQRPRAGFVPPAPRSPPAPAPPPARFARGALIRLESGQLRRVEDMRTEDFVSSAERCADVALLHCTLLRLEERGGGGGALSLTLACRPAAPAAADHRRLSRDQVEVESSVEHPFFVYGRGWASVAPERTLQRYGLSVQRLRVGDVCVSLAARAPPPPPQQPENLSVREERKRRWSAPDAPPPLKKR